MFVVYVYKTVEGKLVCHAYTEALPSADFGSASPLDKGQAERAATQLRTEGWTAMVLEAELLPFPLQGP